MRERARGFTLLELIVVIGIFAVFATMAYGGLDRVLSARKHIEESLARTEEYQRAYQRIRADFESAAPRGVRDGDGVAQPMFGYDGYNKRIEFTRGGWANLLALPRSSLQRVSYFLDDAKIENKKLVRRTWPVLDRAPQTEPNDTPLLEHVDELRFRFLDRNRVWNEAWPPEGASRTPVTPGSNINPAPAPLAVEMTLRTHDWGELRYVFRFGSEQMSVAGSVQGPQGPINTGDSNLDSPNTNSSGGNNSDSGGGGSGGSSSGGTSGGRE